MKPEVVFETINLHYNEPRLYGYLEGYFEEVGEALLEADRNHVTISNVESLLDSDLDERVIGQTLNTLEEVGAIEEWSKNGDGATYTIENFDQEVYDEVKTGMEIAEV